MSDYIEGLLSQFDDHAMPVTFGNPEQPDCPVVYANEAFQDLTGYTASEIIGRNCRFLQGSGTDQYAVRHISAAVQLRDSAQSCLLNYRKDGSSFHNLLFLEPVEVEPGRTLLMGCQYAFNRDVSEHGIEARTAAISSAASMFDVKRNDARTMQVEAVAMRAKSAVSVVQQYLMRSRLPWHVSHGPGA